MTQRESSTSKILVASFSGTDLVRNVYRSVAESDDVFFGPFMLDVMTQRLTRQVFYRHRFNDEDLVARELNASGPEQRKKSFERKMSKPEAPPTCAR